MLHLEIDGSHYHSRISSPVLKCQSSILHTERLCIITCTFEGIILPVLERLMLFMLSTSRIPEGMHFFMTCSVFIKSSSFVKYKME